MKYLYSFLLLFTTITMKAQDFVNGSLEPADNTLQICHNADKNTYAHKMGNSCLTDSNGAGIFIGYRDTCDVPDDGNWFVGLIYLASGSVSPKGDRISLKLATPLVIGYKYGFSFAVKMTTASPPCHICFGTMNDSIGETRGIIDSFMAPTTPGWHTVSDSFVAAFNDQFMFFQAGMPTAPGDGITFVDHFRMTGSVRVNTINAFEGQANVYPNPFIGTTYLAINDPKLIPCSITITDITGRTIVHQTITEQRTPVDLSGYSKGMYLLQLTDSYNHRSTAKLINQ